MISPGLSLGPALDAARIDEWRACALRAWRAQIATAVIGAAAAVFLSCLLSREAWRAGDAEAQLRAVEAAHSRVAPSQPLTFGLGLGGREVWRPPQCDETRIGAWFYFEGTTYRCGADSWWRPAFVSSTPASTAADWLP